MFKIPKIKLLKFIIGDNKTLSLENRIFNISSLIAFIASLVAVLWNFAAGISFYSNISLFFFSIIYALLYYLSKYKGNYYTFIFIFSTLLLLSLQWFSNQGSEGPTIHIYFVALAIFISISNKKHHFLLLVLISINILILYILEHIFYNELIIEYQNNYLREMDLIFGFSVSLVMLYLITVSFKLRHEAEKEKIEQQKTGLQELNATKDKFFSIIAHDLRGPFSGIINLSQLLTLNSKEYSRDKIQEISLMISKSSEDTLNMLENLLNWAKVHQGKINFTPQNLNLYKSVYDIIALLYDQSERKKISIFINISEQLMVFTDNNMLQIVMRNLISNAIKFTPKGGEIMINAIEKDDSLIKFEVSDTGIGMDDLLINNLFKLDQNTNRLGTEKETSSGIGLILCNEFIISMGSELMITSKENEGSKFSFLLPINDKNSIPENS